MFKKKKNYIQPVICPWLTFRFLITYHETIPILKFPAIELDHGMCGTYRDRRAGLMVNPDLMADTL